MKECSQFWCKNQSKSEVSFMVDDEFWITWIPICETHLKTFSKKHPVYVVRG